MRAQISNRDYEQISAYLDGQLSSNEQRKLEDRLRTRPELQTVLDDLRRTKALLRMAPHRRAPRNFILTPVMVGQQKARRNQSTFFNFFPALSFTSALALFALIFSLVFQLTPGSPASMAADRQAKEVAMSPSMDLAAAPTDNAQLQSQAETANPAGAAESPAMESQQFLGTATPEIEAKAEERSAAPDSFGSAPPVITWNNNQGYGGGGGEGIMGKSIGEYAPAPNNASGMGGGAPDGLGASQVLPENGIVVPLQGLNSIEESQPGAEDANPVINPDAYAEQGGGPILGLSPTDQAGNIANSSSWGGPFGIDPGINAAGEDAVEQLPGSGGLSIRLIQILLALFAVSTGVAAFWLYRRNSG